MLRSIAIMVAITISAGLIGCRQDMQDQPKFVPLRSSTFFADGRSARNQVPGTVARGQEQTGTYFLTGESNGKEGNGFPFPVTMQVLERGQERFNIYCSPCHSRLGNGKGIVVERGYYPAANFHSERLRQAPAGHFFSVITHGYGAMPDYHVDLAPADRWAVVAYIRALQLSQNADAADAPPGAHFVNLVQVANKEGLPASFAEEDWISSAIPRPNSAAAARSAPTTSPSTMTASVSPSEPKAPQGAVSEVGSNAEKKTAGSAAVTGTPAETHAGDPAAGKKLYTENCQMCHLANRQGVPGMTPSLEGIVGKVGGPHIRQTITNGIPTAKPPMPSFASKFSNSDVDNLIAFLKTKP